MGFARGLKRRAFGNLFVVPGLVKHGCSFFGLGEYFHNNGESDENWDYAVV